MRLSVLRGTYTVCKLRDARQGDWSGGLTFVGRTPEELSHIYAELRESCYDKDLLVQDMIPGFDESLYSITCFAWQGNVEFSVLGHVLLQDHAPSAIGNPVVIVGDTEMPDWKVKLLDDAKRFLEHVGYTGFANFDVMYDSRDDTYKFLEVNARLGRNSWYLDIAGIDGDAEEA